VPDSPQTARRAFVVVIDACGIGALPDADAYGDAGANTLAHVAEHCGGLQLPVLAGLGLGSILPLLGVPPATSPVLHGRLGAAGPGKDSIAGHWELMGVVVADAPPTYPDGLGPELLERVEAVLGGAVICNAPYNGVGAIEDYGAEHLRSGRPILYTSADSVVQVAAHVDVLEPELLYERCAALRELMGGPDAVGRVIARPFEGQAGDFRRTRGRRDYALAPPTRSYLDELQSAGVGVHSVGKVHDLFAGRGIDEAHPGATNAEALASIDALIDNVDSGLVFANLIETDQRYGHRKDVAGFHAALREIDAALAGWLGRLRAGDLLVISADHGCDPDTAHSDHTRESVPLLARFQGDGGRRHDGGLADVGASVLAWLTASPSGGRGRETDLLPGESFIAASGAAGDA
jgi:phosphopentomutase